MSKFNKSSSTLVKNNEGHISYSMSLKDKLIIEVLASFFGEAKYYGDNSSSIISDIREVLKKDPEFISNLAIYARVVMNQRSISHVLASELAHAPAGKKYVREVINKIVVRADDMSEILAYYINEFGKPIPNALKKGIADKFLTFDEYSLAKYNRDKEVKLRDILCLVHPKAKDEKQNNMFRRLLEGNLETPKTWETKLSAEGNNKESWEELIASNKLGYMAILRNLRNIIESNPTNINKIYEIIANKDRVLKSKQLPFRFYTAYNTLSRKKIGTSKIYSALETAIEHSTRNITKLEGKTFITADVSGSMTSPISRRSDITSADIAVLMLAIANSICEETVTSIFDTTFRLCPMAINAGILSNATQVPVTGGGTDITLPIKYLIDNNLYVDRIIILSDNEINYGYKRTCQSYIKEYKKKVNPKVWVHAIDMQGYGTQQFCGERVNVISGWSERALEFISTVENGVTDLRTEIENYHFKDGEMNEDN